MPPGGQSENGWVPSHAGPDILEWVTVPGTDVTLQLMKGPPLQIMRAYAADYNEFVEPLRDADSAAFTLTNSVPTSNHLNGTAMDLNWNSHRFQISLDGYTPQMVATMRELLDFYEDTMFWAEDWDSPKDCMHHQMGYNTWNNAHTADFITRKIRADGYSTFRRGGAPGGQPPTSSEDQIAQLIIATARTHRYNRDETIATIATGIQESSLNQDATDSTGHRGVYQQDGGYPDRETAVGNVNGFFDRLEAKRISAGASPDIWKNVFWLQQRPSEKSADAAFAHGRQAYLTEIQSRVAAATDYYDRLAPPVGPPIEPPPPVEPPSGDDAVRYPSKSRYGDPSITWTVDEFIVNDDGFLFDLITEHDAALGEPQALARINKAAAAGDKVAQAFLDKLNSPPAPVQTTVPAPVVTAAATPDVVSTTAPTAPVSGDGILADITNTIAQLNQQFDRLNTALEQL